tara:strand:- start:122 stop:556 length:435 start_codon:yes stop_codon:yes gene_type:complete
MAKKKTTNTWIILILAAIGIVFGLINSILKLINIKTLLTPALFSNPIVNVTNLVLSIIGLVILIIFFFKLYNVTPDVIKWTNITFGYSVFQSVFGLILSVFTAGLLALLAVIPLIIVLAIIIVIWITFVNHLKKAQRENLMDFS